MTTESTSEEIKVGKGTKFHAPLGDEMVQFEVTRAQGRGAWRAVAVPDGGDWEGTERVFTTAEITAKLRWDAFNARTKSAESVFFDGLPVGSTAHYDNGFGQYVRCEVILDEAGKTTLLPVALVGAPGVWGGSWASTADYYRKMIAEKKAWRPSCTCVFEWPSYSNRGKHGDPRLTTPV